MTSPEEYKSIQDNPDGFFLGVYGPDAPIEYKTSQGEVIKLALGQALEMESLVRPSGTPPDPWQRRARVHAEALDAAGVLLTEHGDLLELDVSDNHNAG